MTTQRSIDRPSTPFKPAQESTLMAKPRTIFMLVRATTEWLALAPPLRHQFADRVLRPALSRHPHVRLRYFDAEAYSASTSDVLMWDVHSDADYRDLIEDLRETPFWGKYFEVKEIVPSIEDDFARHYGIAGFGASEDDAHK